MSLTRYRLVTPLLVCVLAHAAQDAAAIAGAADGEALEKAYRQHAAFKGLDFARHERPGVVIFQQKSERTDARYLVEIRAHMVAELAKAFDARFAKPLAWSRGSRPMVVWLMKDPAAVAKVAGGPVSYDPELRHALCFPGAPGREDEEMTWMLEGCGLQLVDALEVEGKRVKLSDWIRLGIAHYLACRPQGRVLLNQDPRFAHFDEDLLQRTSSLARKEWTSEPVAQLNRYHHPFAVIGYPTIREYLTACKVGEDDAGGQIDRFSLCSHALVSYLLHAFSGAWKDAFFQTVKQEAAGVHGFAALAAAVPDAQKRTQLTEAFLTFALQPKAAIEAESVAVKGGGSVTGPDGLPFAARFEDPKVDATVELPLPVELALARALLAGTRQLPEEGIALLQGDQSKDGPALRAALESYKALLDAFAAKVAAGEKATLYLPDPEKPDKSVLLGVKSFRPGVAGALVLTRAGKDLPMPIASVPPLAFGESFERLKVPMDAGAKAAVGLIVTAWSAGRPDRAAILARAKGRGFVPTGNLAEKLASLVLLAALAEPLERGAAPGQAAKALAAFQAGFRSLPSRGPVEREACLGLASRALPRLWATGEFLGDALKGVVTQEPDGRVRITYSFDNATEAEDWVMLNAEKEQFDPLGGEGKGKFKVAEGELVVDGPAVIRHRLQFEGDLEVRFLPTINTVETDDGPAQTVAIGPVVGLGARPGGIVAFADIFGIHVHGPGAGSQRTAEAALQKMLKAITDQKPLVLARQQRKLSLGTEGSPLVTWTAPDAVAKGAGVVLVNPPSDEPRRTAIDSVAIVGRPDAASMAPLMGSWAKKTLARF